MFDYPYGNLDELNLDWILEKLKELEDRVAELEEIVERD